MRSPTASLRAISQRSLAKVPQTSRTMTLTLIDLVVGGVLGALVAIAAAAFVAGTRFFSKMHSVALDYQVDVLGIGFHPAIFLGLVIAALALYLVRKVFDLSRWHGPADTIYSAHSTRAEIDVKRGIGSTIAAFVSAAGGASVGQYGPLVHFGATLGVAMRRMFRGQVTSDVVICCGVAAAISAGFDAPLAGILFAHEAVIRHFSFRALGSIATSSVAASAMTNYVFSPPKMLPFHLPEIEQLHLVILPLLIAGVWFGLTAVFFMRSLRMGAALSEKAGGQWRTNILFGIVIVGLICAAVPQVAGLGGSTIMGIAEGHYGLSLLFLILLGKILATSFSLGFGFFGGVFSPALVIGAASGGLAAAIFSQLGLDGLMTVMVLSGMAAVAASVVGAPISTVLIILELSSSYDFALAALLAVVCSVMTSNILFGHSFFDRQLLARGIDISTGRWRLNAQEISVASFVNPDFVQLNADSSVKEAMAQMRSREHTEAYCVTADGLFAGKVKFMDLSEGEPDDPVGRYAIGNPHVLYDDDSLLGAIEVAREFVGESIPVIGRSSGALRGIVSEADIFNAYATIQQKIQELENT